MSHGEPSQPSIVGLVKSALADARTLAQAQAQLAQLEIKQTGQQVGKTGGLLIGALVMGFLGFVFLLVTLAWVLVALGLPYWAGFGIVTLLLLIVAGVLGLMGRNAGRAIKGPDRTVAEIEKTMAALSGPPPGAVTDDLPAGVVGSSRTSGLAGAPGGTPGPGSAGRGA